VVNSAPLQATGRNAALTFNRRSRRLSPSFLGE